MLLHTVNNCAALPSCLRCALPNSAVLLIEDGVYAALPGHPAAASLAGVSKVYALREDCQARGIGDTLVALGTEGELAAGGESAAASASAAGGKSAAKSESVAEDGLVAGVELIDYAGFVRLTVAAHAVQSWY